jgi:hypothetical protein
MSIGLAGPHGLGAPGFQFHLPAGQIARASLGLSACWADHCQLQPCQVLNRDLRLHGVVIVVLPVAPIAAATVVAPAASVVGVASEAGVGASEAVIADRLRPVQPVPSVGPLVTVHLVIAHSVIVHQAIVPSRIGPRVVARSRDVLPVVARSAIDRLAIDPSGTEPARRVTVAQVSNLETEPPGRMLAGHSPVQPVRNAAPNHRARTSFGELGLPSLA